MSRYISLLSLCTATYSHVGPKDFTYPRQVTDQSQFLLVLRYGFVATATTLYASFLGPAFYHLWVYAGSGNANFFYAITLVWSLGLVLIIADFIFAALRDEFEIERPELQGKDVRQI